MRFTNKIPQTDKGLRDLLLSAGWRKIKEPSSLNLTVLFSMPFMIANGAISILITYYIYPPLKDFISNNNSFHFTLNVNFTILLYAGVAFLFIMLHELIHACFIPNFLKSDKTYCGISMLGGFVYTTERIKKSRYILISIMPLIVLSIIFPIILSILGLLNEFVLFLCTVNAMGSSIDCLNICFILSQVPNGSYIVNNGLETYYKS